MPKNIILCVDDEPMVLRLCADAVESAGFRPVVAENGAAGLEIFALKRDEICLVLSDIVMPLMSGIQMADSILQIDPKAKFLLMSGCGVNVIEGRKEFGFIWKPFIYAVLIEKIRSVIGADAEAAASGS